MIGGVVLSFDLVADTYDEIRATPKWVLRRFYETILKEEDRFDSNLIVLDAGVGSGRTVEPLLDFGIQLVGIDVSKKMLEKAAEKVKGKPVERHVNLVRGDVASLPFRTNSFDRVISIHVLWLLEKWKQAILEAKRVLKPEGYFIAANHTSPEFENEVGRKYLKLELNTLGQRKLSKRLNIFKEMRIARKVLEHRSTNLLKRALENVGRYYSEESYLTRKASSAERFAIVWKDIFSVYTIVDLLDKRISALKWSVSTETFEKLKLDLDNWRIKKMEKNPNLEIVREFTFTMVQF